jgi:hypothetical protein
MCKFDITASEPSTMLKRAIIFTLLQLFIISSFAQDKRSDHNIANSKDSSLLINFIRLFKGKPNPLIDSTSITINKSIASIASQEGKRINTIHIEHRHFGTFGFEDSTRTPKFITKAANSLHNFTKENTIKKNLFFHENEYMNPLIIAYNEKWLRDLPYIQDARIVAFPLINDSNSVDMYIITKDVFPFGGSLQFKSANAYDATATLENINDNGNAINVFHNFDINRKDKAGWGINYIARNIFGSFMDLNMGAITLENNYANLETTASNVYIKGNLPLLNPLSKWTGGFDWNRSQNNNQFPNKWSDSLYNASINYQRNHFDAWIGHQLFNKAWSFSNENLRHFIQYRYFDNEFKDRPENYLLQIDKNYQNVIANLFSYSLFKQKIIRTQYLFGLGRNEDLPVGKSMTITSGHYQRENEKLPYLGIQLESYTLMENESFRHLLFSTGSSYLNKELLDFKLLASFEKISRLHYLESGYKYRSMFNLSFAQTLKNKFNDALLINSIYGIPQLNKERIKGGTRITANWESIWYNARSFYGFKQSPFLFANLTYIRTVGEPFANGDIYSSVGAGSRIRNENLIFGTVEIKGFYFPRTNLQLSPWNISITTNLKFKYNSSLLNKPDFVQVN